MPAYTSMGPSDFRNKLKNGEYANLTGARRAIGKMKQWTESDKDNARNYATKHFGGDTAPTQKKAAKKAAKKATKKASKKTAKKVAKKAAKKAPRAPKAAKGAAAPEKRGAPVKTRAPKQARQAGAQEGTSGAADALKMYQSTITTYTEAANALTSCHSQGLNVAAGLRTCSEALTMLVKGLYDQVVVPWAAGEEQGAALFQKAATVAAAMSTPAAPVATAEAASVFIPGDVPEEVPESSEAWNPYSAPVFAENAPAVAGVMPPQG